MTTKAITTTSPVSRSEEGGGEHGCEKQTVCGFLHWERMGWHVLEEEEEEDYVTGGMHWSRLGTGWLNLMDWSG